MNLLKRNHTPKGKGRSKGGPEEDSGKGAALGRIPIKTIMKVGDQIVGEKIRLPAERGETATVPASFGAPALSAEELKRDESITGSVIAGAAIFFIFFVLLGGWAALAPIAGAVVAQGVVKVEGSRKAVQHFDGGIIKQVLVREGDHVASGDLLVLLDDTQARANVNILSKQLGGHYAQEARLTAEQRGAPSMTIRQELAEMMKADPDIADAVEEQRRVFQARKAQLVSSMDIFARQRAGNSERIRGLEGQLHSKQSQVNSLQKELELYRPAADKMVVARSRISEMERNIDGNMGSIRELQANILTSRQAMAEADARILNLQKDREREASIDLQNVQARIFDTVERLQAAKDSLYRTQIRAPYTGTVMGLKVVSEGAVLTKGETVLEIVPDDTRMHIEAKIDPKDIDDVHPGMRAEVHLTSYSRRDYPVFKKAEVVQVSADRFEERAPMPGQPTGYYLATIRISDEQLATRPDLKLSAGMPATVMMTTTERTMLDYLMQPLTESVMRALKEH